MLTTMTNTSTAGASSPDTLTGALVRLWPYAPGVYGRDALYRVWKLMEDDGATKQAFWDDAQGDLVSFVQMFAGPERLLLMIERIDTGTLCGCFWVSQMVPGHQAFVGMWMQRWHRGPVTVDAARLALDYVFAAGNFRQLWALTPWLSGMAICRRMGFEDVAVLPKFCRDGETERAVHVYRLRRT